jgi:hypothetical protein
VEDDLLRATEGATDDYRDNLRIFLDGRQPREIGTGGYSGGVTWFSVYPYDDPDAEPELAGRGDVAEKVKAAAVRTDTGYRVDCAIPWSVFSQVEGRPSVIGFDLALSSYDEEGEEVLRLSWTGRGRQERRPGNFGRLLIVEQD